MIKFFRNIRQMFLVENRFNKYLLYATGEIILVVIGILIALQINNWNEDANDEEQQLLKENFYENTNFEEVNGEIRFKKNVVKGKFWFDPKFIDLLQKTEFRVDWRRKHFEAFIEI